MTTTQTVASSGFTFADYLILFTIAVSVIISFVRGFMREALSLVIWIAAALAGIKFATPFGKVLEPYLHSAGLSYVLAFVILFVAVLIIGVILNVLFGLLIRKTGVGSIDRLLGILFGAVRGILIVAVVLMLVNFTPMSKDDSVQKSILVPHFEPLVTWLNTFLPEKVGSYSNIVVAGTTPAAPQNAAPKVEVKTEVAQTKS